jgi:drug/metabolite transporter (DMT)-like permease
MMNKWSIKQRTIVATIIAVIIGGGVTPLTKIAVQTIPVFSYTFLRFFFASIVILPYFIKHLPRFNKRLYKLILFSLFLSANVIVYPFGVRLTTATIAQTLYVFVPIITAVISYFFLAEIFTIKKITGILISLIGALILILLPEITKSSPFAGNLTGNLIICFGVITVAIYTVFQKNFKKILPPFKLTPFLFLPRVFFHFFWQLVNYQVLIRG